MNNETDRLLYLVVLLSLGQVKLADVKDELVALAEVVGTRSESAAGYHLTYRGCDALERATARKEKREPDYTKARFKAGIFQTPDGASTPRIAGI